MVQASLATDYVVGRMLPPVRFSAVYDVGDGQSLLLEWHPGDPAVIDHYTIYYGPDQSPPTDSVIMPGDSTHCIISGLTDGVTYVFRIAPFTSSGQSSITVKTISGTPYSLPARPKSLTALPQMNAIRLNWKAANTELDFSHYQIIRDQQLLPDSIYGDSYIDDDPALGHDLHGYLVVAADTDGNLSDTAGIVPVV